MNIIKATTTDEYALAGEDAARLKDCRSRMSQADMNLARMLFSIERFGEASAPESWGRQTPPVHMFMAYNLRCPKNRAALRDALNIEVTR